MAKDIRSLSRYNESTGNTEIFYPATTTDAIADRTRQKSLADILGDLENNSGAYDISAAHNNATYADLAAALGTNGANVPAAVRKGGMSVKFVLTSDNKYVQWRYMNTSVTNGNFTNVGNWERSSDASNNPEYNVSLIYPTRGTSGTRIYTLAGAIGILDSVLTSAEKIRGVKVIFYDSDSSIKAYYFTSNSSSNFGTESYWQETPDFLNANGIGGAYDISLATGNSYNSLADVLGTNAANIPVSIRQPGMSIKFNKKTQVGEEGGEPIYSYEYVQYRYMIDSTNNANFTNVANWQGVDDELSSNSKNLVINKGVFPLKGLIAETNSTPTQKNITISGTGAQTTQITLLAGKSYIIWCRCPTVSYDRPSICGLYIKYDGGSYELIRNASKKEFVDGFYAGITPLDDTLLYVRTEEVGVSVSIKVYDSSKYLIDSVIIGQIASDSFIYTRIDKNASGNIWRAIFKWADGISGVATFTYTNNLITQIDYTRGGDTYRQTISYSNGEFSSNNIVKL